MENKIERARQWLAYKLAQVANWVHPDYFLYLCEVAVLEDNADTVRRLLAERDVTRLEQEHAYEYNNEKEQEYETVH